MIKGIYANIIVDISHEKVDRPFQYRIPEGLLGRITPGTCVVVPFGRGNKELTGYVIELTDRPDYAPEKTKEILRISDKGALAESSQIRLAAWMKEHYGSTMIAALKTVLPARRKMRTPSKRRIYLAVPPAEAAAALEECRRKHQNARLRLLECLYEKKEIPYEYAVKELSVTPAVIRAMEKKGMAAVASETAYRNPVRVSPAHRTAAELSGRQREIVSEILADYRSGRPGVYLIHGITGSGKTEVYMELIAGMTALGKQSIVLIPEIALTYQTVSRFTSRFGDRVSVLHSRLSAGEKYDQCQRAKNGEIDIIIGPRSALFTPFPKLGLIIIDEEHEASYKSESMPKYHAREAAKELASYYGASVALGSATPSLESYYASETGRIRRFELDRRYGGGRLPEVYVEDMRKELRGGNRSIFSRRLGRMLEQRLEAGEQSMLFLNRRGYAGFVSCRACGYVMKCPNCDVSLSEHRNGRLVCHYCGYEQPSVVRCPECGSKYILGFRAGTEQIEENVHRLFPKARVLRMDADTTRKKESHEEILSAFAGGGADILVGTQMIVKGHDFPNVTLVGVLAADLSLHAGDYRAGERTFQLLTQAAGRAGRGKKPGEVVIQTYQPEHYSIRCAAAQDYRAFYQEEMGYRELMGYPPAAHMLAVLVLSAEEEAGRKLAEKLAGLAAAADKDAGPSGGAQSVADKDAGPSGAAQSAASGDVGSFCSTAGGKSGQDGRKVQIIGPAPAAIGRLGGQYRTVLYAKSASMESLIEIKDRLETFLEREKPVGETVQFDFDPMNCY